MAIKTSQVVSPAMLKELGKALLDNPEKTSAYIGGLLRAWGEADYGVYTSSVTLSDKQVKDALAGRNPGYRQQRRNSPVQVRGMVRHNIQDAYTPFRAI